MAVEIWGRARVAMHDFSIYVYASESHNSVCIEQF